MSTDIYLDVDGVLNAVSPSTPRSWGWGESECVTVNGFPIRYSPLLVERLNALAAREDVTVWWLTTWERDAATLLAPAIGLNGSAWEVLGTDEHYSKELADGWWKWHAVVDHFLSSGTRAVWIDDDLGFDRKAQEWAAMHVADGTLLTVSPATHRGLTVAEFDAIESWIAVSQ